MMMNFPAAAPRRLASRKLARKVEFNLKGAKTTRGADVRRGAACHGGMCRRAEIPRETRAQVIPLSTRIRAC